MARLEDLKLNAQVKGIDPSSPVAVLNVKWRGLDVIEVTYRDIGGRDHGELLFRDSEANLQILVRPLDGGASFPGGTITASDHGCIWRNAASTAAAVSPS